MTDTTPTFDQDIIVIEQELVRLDRLARTLDSRFLLPGTSIRFGLDTIVGLIPGIGDTLMAAPSAWMIWRGHKMGVNKWHLARMARNTGLDYVIGAIPIIGDIFDVGFKANLRNVAILHEQLSARKQAHSSAQGETGASA